MIGEGQIFNSQQENYLIFAKILPSDNRARSIFQWNHQIYLILAKMPTCVVRAGQIFKSLQQNRFIFAKISARDNRGTPDFQVNWQNLPYFCQGLARDDRGSSNFQKASTKHFVFEKISACDNRSSSDFQNTLTKRFIFAFLPKFQLVIIEAVWILKGLHKICHIFAKV